MTRAVWQDRDRGWDRIVQNIFREDGKEITVGVHGEAGSGPDGVSVVDIAMFNEFGTSRIPARSFIRSTFDENLDKWQKLFERMMKLIGTGFTQSQMMNTMGLKMQSDIQKKIVSLKSPPNAPSTIKMKGSSNPLINEGILKARITYKVG